jgi:transcriptional regulator with XRE-family HTH domain
MKKINLPDTAGFASRLMYQRQQMGMTQAELARRAKSFLGTGRGLDRASISRYESGSNVPRPEALSALAQVLDVPIDDLMPRQVPLSEKMPARASGDAKVELVIKDDPEMARITLNDVLLPYEAVLEILRIVRENRQSDPGIQSQTIEKKES